MKEVLRKKGNSCLLIEVCYVTCCKWSYQTDYCGTYHRNTHARTHTLSLCLSFIHFKLSQKCHINGYYTCSSVTVPVSIYSSESRIFLRSPRMHLCDGQLCGCFHVFFYRSASCLPLSLPDTFATVNIRVAKRLNTVLLHVVIPNDQVCIRKVCYFASIRLEWRLNFSPTRLRPEHGLFQWLKIYGGAHVIFNGYLTFLFTINTTLGILHVVVQPG